jgi:photosystem II stability/assembly factor-like uncharacterized protein
MDRLRRALEQIKIREHALEAKSGVSGGKTGGILGWTEVGPGNIGGRTRALAVDPRNGDVIYAGGVSGGVWKSTDGGASWRVADDLMLNMSVSTLVIDPIDPDVIYAGTGEGFFWHWSMARGLGIFKSVDAGETWSQLEGSVTNVPDGAFHFVNDLEISPTDHNRLYAATSFGAWRSDDAGLTWRLLIGNTEYVTATPHAGATLVGCTDVSVHREDGQDVVLAAFGVYQADGLYRTSDEGGTWERVLTGPFQGRMAVAVAPSRPRTIYVSMAANTSGTLGKLVDVYKSTNGGRTWSGRVNMSTRVGPWLLSNAVYATECATDQDTYHQGWYDNVIAVDPHDPDIVWVGGIDLYRSADGATNFHPASFWWAPQIPSIADALYVHADHHALVFHPDFDGVANQTLYAGNDGGVYRTDVARAYSSPDECPFIPGAEFSEFVWTSLNNGYGVTQFYHGDAAAGGELFVAGGQDNGTSMVKARDTPNDWQLIYYGDGGYVAIDPRDPDTFYVERERFPTIAKTTDGGMSFVDATSGISDTDGLFITPFAMDPNDPDVLWTGGSRPWRTSDGAVSWTRVGDQLDGRISAVGIAPSDSRVVYLGLDSGRLYRTGNALGNAPVWTSADGNLPRGWISSIAVDPLDSETVYCTISTFGMPHVLVSRNGGTRWEPLDGIGATGIPEIPAHWIVVRPCNRLQLYVGTELGVFASNDGGATWNPVNDGLAHTVVESLDFAGDDTLVAFTRGRGTFITSLDSCLPAPRHGGRRLQP